MRSHHLTWLRVRSFVRSSKTPFDRRIKPYLVDELCCAVTIIYNLSIDIICKTRVRDYVRSKRSIQLISLAVTPFWLSKSQGMYPERSIDHPTNLMTDRAVQTHCKKLRIFRFF